jgi:hypothetical protein
MDPRLAYIVYAVAAAASVAYGAKLLFMLGIYFRRTME